MKKHLLGATIIGIASFSLAFLAINNSPEKQYTPRENANGEMAAHGAMEWNHKIRANQVTGEINLADVRAAEEQLANMSSYNKAANLGLNWTPKGPDNVGGRTRGFIIDKDDHNLLYAAGVAGGVFKSTNGGLSWVPISEELDNMAVVSLCQASNGDLYAGTGEGLYTSGAFGGTAGSSGKTGGGVYKSTDNGQTWSALSSTVPPSNSTSSIWSSVGVLAADPVDSNRIYAVTAGGLRRSDNGGLTWTNPVGASSRSTDLAMGADGSIWVNVGAFTYYSPNGNDNSFSEISKNPAGTNDLPRNGGRQRYAISPQDENVVYCVQTQNSALRALYRTEDKGATWELIQEATSTFDPLCSTSGYCQGGYDLMLSVSPFDKNHVFLGGISVWEWKKSSGWRQVSGFGPFNIHVDQHNMVFDPVNPNVAYIVSDGGVTKSTDAGFTWQEMNKNYITAQFYQMGIGQDRTMIGGTQDNGSWYVDGTGNTSLTGTELGFVAKPDGSQLFKGDGFFSHISWLNDVQYYTAYQNGRMGRSRNKGVDLYEFFDARMTLNGQPGSGAFADWRMPYIQYEVENDANSWDSVYFNAIPSIRSLGFQSDTTYTGTLNRPQPTGIFVPESFNVVSGGMTIVSDASGNLSGSGYGTFDAATGAFDFTFDNTPVAEILITCNVRYQAGSVVMSESKINSLPFNYTLPQDVAANDSIKLQDQVQALVIAGTNNGVWMTREPHNWDVGRTEWWKVAEFSGTTTALAISEDGTTIWAGTNNGLLVRINNVEQGRSRYTADAVYGPDSNILAVEHATVRNFGRHINDIAIDPNDKDNVIVVLGNYGNSTYIYYSDNGTATSPSFVQKQGNMPSFPVFAATFDKGTSGSAIIGTEYGIFSTSDITASAPSWTEENNGIPRVPVHTLVQYRTSKSSSASDTIFEGDIFAASHGRGFYHSVDLMNQRPISIVEEEQEIVDLKSQKQLEFYPNPAIDYTKVILELNSREDVTIFVRDINGRMMNQLKFNNMPAGKTDVRINTSDFSAGTYLVTVQMGDNLSSGKFVVQK